MPLTGSSSSLLHVLQNLCLVCLSLSFIPLSTYILLLSYAFDRVTRVFSPHGRRPRLEADAGGKIILVTGIGMTKGLTIARLFYLAGHTVIGADFEPHVCGRMSRALSRFYQLAKPTISADGTSDAAQYCQSLLSVILREKVDLWVSCSSVASAVEDGEAREFIEARTFCRAIQFDAATTCMLHEKHSFIERVSELGLTAPETHTVTSQEGAEKVIGNAAPAKKFIMKNIAMDDASRADMTLLSRSTPGKTHEHLSRLKISPERPWIVQEYISGREFCTHSLIVRGEVAAFVACPSEELLMHYEMLPAHTALSKRMLEFTMEFAESGGQGFTGHLSFDFLVTDTDLRKNSKDEDITLYPIECNPRAHTAIVLFNGHPDLASHYLAALKDPMEQYTRYDGTPKSWPAVPMRPASYYWLGHDLTALVFLPILHFFIGVTSTRGVLQAWTAFAEHLLFWKDGTYEVWDPLPFWWLYHVYWPIQFLRSIRSGKWWSRINVSTTKMFYV